MENSIEETINTTEKMIKSYKEADKCGLSNNDFKNETKALELILSDYKRVLKENEVLKNQEATARKINELLVQRYSYSISKQTIKDKIEELKKEKEEYYSQYKIDELNDKIQALQELLESEEK